ncbi:unnamed protein product [Caenorhabditis brenneri]
MSSSLLTPKQKDRIKRISILYELQQITLSLSFYSISADPMTIEYKRHASGTVVMCRFQGVTVLGKDFLTVFCEDLQQILASKKSIIQEFRLEYAGFDGHFPEGNSIFECLKAQGRLKIKNLTLEITNIDQVISILPYLEPEVLEKVDLTLRNEDLDVENVLGADEWENFEDLEMEFTMEELTTEELMTVKEVMLSTSILKNIEFHFESIENRDLDGLFGNSVVGNNQTANIKRILETQDLRLTTYQTDDRLKIVRSSLPSAIPAHQNAHEPQSPLSRCFANYEISKNLLKYTDGIDIQCLRKVSSTIRDNIDILTPDPKIQEVHVESNGYGQISVTYNTKSITYEDEQEDCIVGNQYLPNENYILLFLADFQSILKYQRGNLHFFELKFRDDVQFLSGFCDYLKAEKLNLKIEKFKMELLRQTDAMTILPRIDHKSLRSIELGCPSVRNVQTLLDIDQIVQLEQWKAAQEIIISSFVISTSVRQVLTDNLVNADMRFEVVSMQDLHYLKEKFLTFPNLLRFKISFNQFSNHNNEPWEVLDLDRSSASYYRIPNNSKQSHLFPSTINTMPPGGALTTTNQQNFTPAGATSAQKPRQSRKRPHPSTEKKSKRVDLVINRSVTPLPAGSFGRDGYCRVRNGQILQGRYKIEELLGSGAFSSVHKAEDQTTKNTVAVKIIRSEKRFNDSSDKEIGFMKRVGQASGSELDSESGRGSGPDSPIGSDNVIRLLDNFQIKGSNGIHAVLVFEMLGPDLFSVLFKSNHTILNLQRIRRFSKDILNGLDFLHSKCKIMHLDLKPENLLVMVDPKNMDLADRKCSASLKIGDFGLSAYSTHNVKRTVQTCNYRAPEAHLKAEITPSTDIWSFGCTLYEMVTRELLFPCNGKDNCDKKWHFKRISELLGPIKRKYFERDEKDKQKFEEVFGEKKVFNRDPAVRNKISFEEIRMKNAYVYAQAQALSEFLKKILKIDPKKRLSAREALEDPFLSEERCPLYSVY